MKKKRLAPSSGRQTTRKEKRKAERQLKKAKKNEHYFKIRNKPAPLHPSKISEESKAKSHSLECSEISQASPSNNTSELESEVAERPLKQGKTLVERIKEASERSKKIADRKRIAEQRSRNVQLKEANKLEDKQIKHLAMLMKMNKRKKKGKTPSTPKVFSDDGLDYLLDVTDPEKVKSMRSEQPTFEDADNDFESDFALVKSGSRPEINNSTSSGEPEDSKVDVETMLDSDDFGEKSGSDEMCDDEGGDSDELAPSDDDGSDDDGDNDAKECADEVSDESDWNELDNSMNMTESNPDAEVSESSSDTGSDDGMALRKKLKRKSPKSSEQRQQDGVEGQAMRETPKSKKRRKGEAAQHEDGVWEDIYGRLRGKDGSVLAGAGADPASTTAPAMAAPSIGGRYVPPALRAQQMALSDDKQSELAQLRRRLQGQLNRLSAQSARGVLALVEELYGAHSRHDTSQTLTQLIHEACVSPAAALPDRLVMEHVLLMAALHANVGTEVGAHFLLKTAQWFHKLLTTEPVNEESKELDNLVTILSHLYLFRVTDSTVVYDILALLVERFSAKDVELILVVLRSVGFTMRRDDPRALKELIVRLQARASAAASADGSRVRFMLDIVMALRNNNMNKIPQYDPSLGEQLRKLLKTLVNPNQTLTELNISLEDLLKAEERGKWWVVGSAWSGNLKERQQPEPVVTPGLPSAGQQRYSAELLELARQQRMNTDLRRNVFCVVMTAEDYLDGFEKLVRLGVRGSQQEQQMVSVVLGCGLRERNYNPYYSHLLERFCTTDRKYQMRTKTAVWDHLKSMGDLGAAPAANLAKTLAHLISNGLLTVAVLKVVEFSEMSRPMVRFLRQLLLSLLLQPEDGDAVRSVFSRASGQHLRHLRDSLVLFLHHFVLRNKHKLADERTLQTLEDRVKLAIGALKISEGRLQL